MSFRGFKQAGASVLAGLRRNAVAWTALFVALGGTGYAVGKLDGDAATRKFGSSVYFGRALDFGPINAGNGGGFAVPLLGGSEVDDNSIEPETGGYVMLTPVPLRLRDVRMESFLPLERPVELRIGGGDLTTRPPDVLCRIPAGKRQCKETGPSGLIRAGVTVSAMLFAPIRPDPLPQHDFTYSFRVIPG